MYSQSQLHTTLFCKEKKFVLWLVSSNKEMKCFNGHKPWKSPTICDSSQFFLLWSQRGEEGFLVPFSFRKHKAKIKLAMSLFLLGVLSHFKSDPKEVTQFWAGGHGITARKFHGDLTISLMNLIASTDALTSIRSPTICDSSQFFSLWSQRGE